MNQDNYADRTYKIQNRSYDVLETLSRYVETGGCIRMSFGSEKLAPLVREIT